MFFKNNFHNKAKKVYIETRSPSPSLPSLTVKWPIGSEVTDRAKVQGRFCSHFSWFSLRIQVTGESNNITGEYFERGFTSE